MAWHSMIAQNLAWVRRREAEATDRPRRRPCAFESLESRRMLAADIAITGFDSDGFDWQVEYDISGQNATAFEIAVYRSSDGSAHDAKIGSVSMTDPADLAVGTGHLATLTPDFSDVESNYYLIAEVDSLGQVAESNESNNELLFEGGVFLADDGTLHIHGTDAVADQIDVTSATDWEVDLNGASHVYADAEVQSLAIRSHGSADIVHTEDFSKASVMFTGAGDDRVYSGSGADSIWGGDGRDLVYSGAGNDHLFGEDGRDYLSAGDGNDEVFGGDDTDFIIGESGDDVLHGGAGHDRLLAGAGNDQLDGGSGDDLLTGDVGDDVYLFSGADDLGTDRIYESVGEGTDTLDFSGLTAGNAITIDLAYGGFVSQAVNSEIELKLESGTDIENVIGSSYDDTILGNSADNTIYGGDGDDLLIGGNGTDTLFGEIGSDSLYGDTSYGSSYGGASDFLYGGEGDDELYGEAGDDYLEGGSGVDSLSGGGQAGDEIADNPLIDDFEATENAGIWSFSGEVIDDDVVAGMTILFGGLLAGHSTTVAANGTFFYSWEFDPGLNGVVSAVTTDAEGLQSNTAFETVVT